MERKVAAGIKLTLLVLGMLTLAFNIEPVKAGGTIYIRADGSVDPSTAPISSVDQVTYTFTDNINDSIMVERDNIVIDGAGYTVQGAGSGTGIDLIWRNNVTIENTNIKGFERGVNILHAYQSTDMRISGNNITNNGCGIKLYRSQNNIISGNNIKANTWSGIYLELGSHDNNISGNNITNNERGIETERSGGNSIYENNIKANNEYGIYLFVGTNNAIYGNNITNNAFAIQLSGVGGIYSAYHNSIYRNNITNNGCGVELEAYPEYVDADIVPLRPSNNRFYHNNFIDNTEQVHIKSGCTNSWDEGYPLGGNYWSDYAGLDLNIDGMGDTAYVIDEDNRDKHPLMRQWSPAWSPPPSWMQWWLWATVLAVIIAASAATVYFLKKRKPPTPTAPTPPTESTLQNSH